MQLSGRGDQVSRMELSTCKKCQFFERRVSTPKDLVNTSPSVPNDLSVSVPDVKHPVLRNKFFVRRLLLPTAHSNLQLPFKPVHKSNYIVFRFKCRVPNDAVDDVCCAMSDLMRYV